MRIKRWIFCSEWQGSFKKCTLNLWKKFRKAERKRKVESMKKVSVVSIYSVPVHFCKNYIFGDALSRKFFREHSHFSVSKKKQVLPMMRKDLKVCSRSCRFNEIIEMLKSILVKKITIRTPLLGGSTILVFGSQLLTF